MARISNFMKNVEPYYPYIVFLLVIIMVVFIILILVYSCKDENFKSSLTVKRPHHPKWYKDIPENHPEVLDLIKQTKTQSKRVPTFTSKGFTKTKIPEDIYNVILDLVNKTDRIKEDEKNIFRRTSIGPPPYIIPIPEEKKSWVHNELKKYVEKWSNTKLTPTSIYGCREYRRGSSLRMHVDTEDTHILSLILHIKSENMDKDWPLVVINREGVREEVFMKAGEMVLYESASLPHSREQKLQGDYYVNMFLHYKPQDYEWYKDLKKKHNKIL